MFGQYPIQGSAQYLLYRSIQRGFAVQQALQDHQHHHGYRVNALFRPLSGGVAPLLEKLRKQRGLEKLQRVQRGIVDF
jgi:hypothetical protein